MSKKEDNELSNNLLIADALLRLKTLENLLVKKGIINQEDFTAEMEVIARQIAKSILEKANAQGDIDELVKSLRSTPPPKPPTEN